MPLALHHPDDAVTLTTDPYPLSQGVGATDQLLAHLAAKHGKGAGVGGIILRQKTSQGRFDVPDTGDPGAGAEDHRPAGSFAVLYRRITLDHRHHRLNLGQAAEGISIVQTEGAYIVDHRSGDAEGTGFARHDGNQVGAELAELAQDKPVNALADGGEQYHGGDADGDTQGSKKAAHAVGDDRSEGESDSVFNQHGQRPESAWIGSSRAARRAGSTPNSRPVISATSSAAAIDQSGMLSGKSGNSRASPQMPP